MIMVTFDPYDVIVDGVQRRCAAPGVVGGTHPPGSSPVCVFFVVCEPIVLNQRFAPL